MSIVLENIKKRYINSGDKVNVLNGISLSINTGDIITVLGHSGVGKSTLLSIMSGVLYPDEGTVSINDKLLSPSNSASVRKKTISVLFQKDNLLPEFNIRDNLLLPLIINDVDYHSAIDRVDEILELLKMKEFKYRYPYQISRG